MSKDIDKDKADISEVSEGTEEIKDQKVAEEDVEEKPEMKVNDENMSDEGLDDADEHDSDEIEKLTAELQEAKDKYLRLYSEFENFRRRTAKERLELIKSANEDLMKALLPVMDDFERGKKAMEESEDHTTSKEGFELIYNKFGTILKQKGLKPMEDEIGSEFNTEFHEAISQMPVDKKKMKGKIIDVVEKGYFLDEKVIRFAKVVIGG